MRNLSHQRAKIFFHRSEIKVFPTFLIALALIIRNIPLKHDAKGISIE